MTEPTPGETKRYRSWLESGISHHSSLDFAGWPRDGDGFEGLQTYVALNGERLEYTFVVPREKVLEFVEQRHGQGSALALLLSLESET